MKKKPDILIRLTNKQAEQLWQFVDALTTSDKKKAIKLMKKIRKKLELKLDRKEKR